MFTDTHPWHECMNRMHVNVARPADIAAAAQHDITTVVSMHGVHAAASIALHNLSNAHGQVYQVMPETPVKITMIT